MILGGALLGIALLGGGPVAAVVVDRVAAVVNDDVITLSEVYDLGSEFIEQHAVDGAHARRAAELEVLESLVQRSLISQEIDRLGLEVGELEMERAVDDIARRNGLERDQLRIEVERTGMSWALYREELRENLRQSRFSQAVIQPRISVNEDELQDAYRRSLASDARPQTADLGAIFFPFPADSDAATRDALLAEADAAHARIDGGEAFSAVAAEVDRGPYGARGGAMGSYRQGELVAELDGPAFALPEGAVSAPIATGQGIFLLEIRNRQTDEAPTFEEARDQIFEQVYADRIEDEVAQWYEQARRGAAVSIKLQEAEDLPLLP